MEAKAIARFARIAPRKARVVANLVRGRSAQEAQSMLKFTRKSAAAVVAKLLDSAIANAKQKDDAVDLESLFIATIYVDKAPTKFQRRWRPRAMGRATRITKGTSHITLVLGEKD
jgi:large subunit ribosomal protein L22